MEFAYKTKHNLKFHKHFLNTRKVIPYSVLGAPKNTFEVATGTSSKFSKTELSTERLQTTSLCDGDSTSLMCLDDRQKRRKIDISDIENIIVMETSLAHDETSSSLDCGSLCDDGSCIETENATCPMIEQPLNSSATKVDYEIAGMVGDIIELLEKGKALYESFEGEGYCEVIFMSSVEDFASELNDKSHFLLSSTEKAISIQAEKVNVTPSITAGTESCVISNDPAERKGIQLNDQQKHFLISKGSYQPLFKDYPCNKAISKSKQNPFSSKWYETLPYLEYSPSLDRAFCFACSLFGNNPRSSCTETSWSHDGVNRWDKMKSRGKNKKGKLFEHFNSSSHRLAAERLRSFKLESTHVDVVISSARKKQLAQEEQERLQNRKVINVLLDCCRYLSRQALAFRGSDNDINGNFRQIVNLVSRWIPFMKNWIVTPHSRPYHVTYLSAKSQNEFISILGSETRKILTEQVRSSGVYAVMADTTPDIGHVDQISLILRFVNEQFQIEERLLMISEINDKTGDGFAQKVIKMLEELQLPLTSVRFQCYDTTASMSGAYNGAQAKLSEHLGRTIPYITCMGHKTNLCVEHSCKVSLMIDEFFFTLQDMYNFLTRSTSRFGKLKKNIESLQEGLIMKNLSKTRWIGRAESIRAVWISYEIVIDTLDDINNFEGGDRDARRTSVNLLDRIKSFEFYLSLLFMKNIMYKTKIVVLEVQEIDQDILASLDVMRHTRDAMLRIREDNVGLDGIISAAADKCKSVGIDVDYEFLKKHRRRKLPIRFHENTENASAPAPLFNQHYRQEMVKVVDRLVSDMEEVNEYLTNIVLPVTILLPNNIAKCTMQQVEKLCATFPDDLNNPDALLADIEMMGNDIEKSDAKNLREAAKCLLGYKRFYPTLAKAYQLALTIPVSVASNERSFSTLRLVKNYLRSTMKENRLDDLMIISSAKDILDNLDLDNLAGSWFICKTRKIKI